MTVELRPVETEQDIASFLDARARVDPEHPITRANFDDGRERPDRIDVLAFLRGEAVGAAWANLPSTSETSEFLFVSVRVVPERRRRGAGTALFRCVSEHARALERARLYTVTRQDDADTFDYLGKRGYVELTRMEDLELDLTELPPSEEPPVGIEIVPVAAEHERGMYDVGKEADADVPSPDPFRAGTFEEWSRRELRPRVFRELSFVALDGSSVVAGLGDARRGSTRFRGALHDGCRASGSRPRRRAGSRAEADPCCARSRAVPAEDAKRSRQYSNASGQRASRLQAAPCLDPPRRPAAVRHRPAATVYYGRRPSLGAPPVDARTHRGQHGSIARM